MKFTGKYLAEHLSSYVEFEVDELPTAEQERHISDARSCYEAIWFGKSTYREGGFSVIISFDEADQNDLQLVK